MVETGRCLYCGSEDVEEYSDGTLECLECGMTWNGEKQERVRISSNKTHAPKNKSSYKMNGGNFLNESRKMQENNTNIAYRIFIAAILWGGIIACIMATCS